jgi:hypothetical protein
LPILQHARVQPLLDVASDALVRNPMLDELFHPFMVDGVEETTNVCIKHPIHLPRSDPDR